jgi:hypothetical protein
MPLPWCGAQHVAWPLTHTGLQNLTSNPPPYVAKHCKVAGTVSGDRIDDDRSSSKKRPASRQQQLRGRRERRSRRPVAARAAFDQGWHAYPHRRACTRSTRASLPPRPHLLFFSGYRQSYSADHPAKSAELNSTTSGRAKSVERTNPRKFVQSALPGWVQHRMRWPHVAVRCDPKIKPAGSSR